MPSPRPLAAKRGDTAALLPTPDVVTEHDDTASDKTR
jgi:hypothetical protein